MTSAKDRDEIAAAKSILAVAPAQKKTQFVPRIAGVHGSSTLREDKNRAGEAENWRAVEQFLNFRRRNEKPKDLPRQVLQDACSYASGAALSERPRLGSQQRA